MSLQCEVCMLVLLSAHVPFGLTWAAAQLRLKSEGKARAPPYSQSHSLIFGTSTCEHFDCNQGLAFLFSDTQIVKAPPRLRPWVDLGELTWRNES